MSDHTRFINELRTYEILAGEAAVIKRLEMLMKRAVTPEIGSTVIQFPSERCRKSDNGTPPVLPAAGEEAK